VGRLAALLALGLLAGPAATAALAVTTPMVDLGQASTYAVLSGASVGNTVSADDAPHTTLRGDLGVKADAQPTGFPPGVVTGAKHIGDAAAAQAHADLVSAYAEVAARTGATLIPNEMVGATRAPGLYRTIGAASNTGTLTLDAGNDPDAVFVFQVNGALAFAAGSHVVLAHGAQASRVFWQVNGAGSVGADADFAGTLMALDAVGMGNSTVVNGRAFARTGALTLDNNQFYSAPPTVTIDGGAAVSTPDTTPAISGTTDVESPGVVTVTVAGQTLTATPSGGAWSVTSAILANGTYPVVAAVTDGAGNRAVATQELTVDTVLPVVTIDGGASVLTNDPTPTISGITDAAPGTLVSMGVGAQTLTALVQWGNTWNVTPTALSDGTRTVTASVTDPAGNAGTDSQTLTVDTTAPTVSITGGASALTKDATPDISGISDAAAGTTVTVTVSDQSLTGLVQSEGTWSVTAARLEDGAHQILVSVADAAGNPAGAAQWLTTDTVAPAVAITGGATATTEDLDPTITGTSDAAPGTTVTVSIAGQTLTTLLQGNSTWNATPAPVGEGTWTVVASAPDPAGNVGSAEQQLTIGAAPTPTPTPTVTATPEPTVTATPEPTVTATPQPTVTASASPEPTATATAQPTATATAEPTATATAEPTVTATATPLTPPASGTTVASGNTLDTGIVLRCPKPARARRCKNTMRVYTRAGRAKRFRIGSFRYNVKPGARRHVVLKLTRRGKRLLARRKTLKVTLVAITRSASGRRTVKTSHRTLRR
jgi:hypothetical protein